MNDCRREKIQPSGLELWQIEPDIHLDGLPFGFPEHREQVRQTEGFLVTDQVRLRDIAERLSAAHGCAKPEIGRAHV